ncbi:class I SAM-dependent RNA methyltransferase [Ruegeria pomeroyi]|nr:class I SAM-dependent RNA methyltransferase [Ruegeria pomeroyi]MCE8526486.1 class I SAM-dependent RNA methyltransferase [Ruegeria pomeroyi]MCE8529741.1 class I SAM-dependent RNA methyltransferase [Ruegeria pomeroyi]
MTQEITITRLGHQGDGIAPGPIYVPRTLPGEVVSGTPEGDRLADMRVVTPSPHRVTPPCRHYRACGGCQLQHASDGFVAQWKQEVVHSALTAQGIEAEMRPVHTSPPRSRRRATIAVRRTKKGALAGFHGRASDVITEIPDCQLLDPALLAAIPVAEALAMLGGSRKGVMAVTLTLSDAGLDVAVRGGKPLDGPLEVALGQLAEARGLARLAWEGEVIAMRHPPTQRFGKAAVAPPPGAFLQATRDGEQALLAAVQETVAGARRVADLFAGCGTFALPLAETAEVHAVEGEAAMTAALDQGWRRAAGLKRVTTEARDLFRRPLLPDELAAFDAVVLDPPRAGAEAQVAELARAKPPVIAYVSCNPVTFARDAKTLVQAGYRLNWVQVVDQFRWSAHVELAASFSRVHIGG